MATVAHLLDIARGQVGYVEAGGPDGHSGNITKFWTDLIQAHLAEALYQGQPWCAGFDRWVQWKAGAPLLPIINPYFVPNLVRYAKDHGLWDSDGHYRPGDMIIYDFEGNGVGGHVGIVVADDGTTVITIEGNTSAEGVVGSQANGGGVYLRHRPHGPTILGVLRYSKFLDVATPVSPPRHPIARNPYHAPHELVRLHDTGTPVKWVQWAVGLHGAQIDGAFGRQTLSAVLDFQRHHRDANGRPLRVDGQVGALTRAALAKVTH